MSILTTRLLVLGIVRAYGPANGYQLRRELLSWDVEEWAHLRSGSIYSILKTLEKQSLIERHELGKPGRAVSVYTITDEGMRELGALAREAIAVVPDPGDVAPLRALLNLGSILSRGDVLDALRQRIEVLREAKRQVRGKAERLADPAAAPSQVFSGLDLVESLITAQLVWVESFLADIEHGAHHFFGEPFVADWARPADGPAARMEAERADYLRRIAELDSGPTGSPSV